MQREFNSHRPNSTQTSREQNNSNVNASEQEDEDESDEIEIRSIGSDNSDLEELHINSSAENHEDGNDSSVTELDPDTGATEREAEASNELNEADCKKRKELQATKRAQKQAKLKALKRAKKCEDKEKREKENLARQSAGPRCLLRDLEQR